MLLLIEPKYIITGRALFQQNLLNFRHNSRNNTSTYKKISGILLPAQEAAALTLLKLAVQLFNFINFLFFSLNFALNARLIGVHQKTDKHSY